MEQVRVVTPPLQENCVETTSELVLRKVTFELSHEEQGCKEVLSRQSDQHIQLYRLKNQGLNFWSSVEMYLQCFLKKSPNSKIKNKGRSKRRNGNPP